MFRIYTTRSSQVKLEHYEEFLDCVEDLLEHPVVQEMGRYQHHGNTTTLEHCMNVAYYNYVFCRKFGLDARSAARGGLLHDLFLYDWHTVSLTNKEHAYLHPKVALANAEKYFDLNDIEREIISMHMWPYAQGRPMYLETYCICLTDKYCATLEASKVYRPIEGMRSRKLAFAMSTLR